MTCSQIKIYLPTRGIEQKDIARALRISPSTVSLLLTSRKRIDPQLDRIADYLGIFRTHLDSLIYADPPGVLSRDQAAGRMREIAAIVNDPKILPEKKRRFIKIIRGSFDA